MLKNAIGFIVFGFGSAVCGFGLSQLTMDENETAKRPPEIVTQWQTRNWDDDEIVIVDDVECVVGSDMFFELMTGEPMTLDYDEDNYGDDSWLEWSQGGL